MIEFDRKMKPTVTNRKCLRCSEECKQHADLKVIVCPNFMVRRDMETAV